MDENGSGSGRSEEEVLDAIEAAPPPGRKLLDDQITLSHGRAASRATTWSMR